jgi:hypothetical protein
MVEESAEKLRTRFQKSWKGNAARYKSAIRYLFTGIYGSPEPSQWSNLNVIPQIMTHLGIPRGSRPLIVDVMNRCVDNGVHDMCSSEKGLRRKYIILNCVMRQLSIICCTAYVNEWRDYFGTSRFSFTPEKNFIEDDPLVVTNKRGTKKSGISDMSSL